MMLAHNKAHPEHFADCFVKYNCTRYVLLTFGCPPVVLKHALAGMSVPAHKGINKAWDRMEARYFPHKYEQHQKEKRDRDAELREAENGQH